MFCTDSEDVGLVLGGVNWMTGDFPDATSANITRAEIYSDISLTTLLGYFGPDMIYHSV